MRMPNWFREERGEIRFLRAYHLYSSGLVKHGFSTRLGGVSEPPYDSLNLGLAVDDDPARVINNRSRFSEALGVGVRSLVVADQVHSNAVRVVTSEDSGSGALDHSSAMPATDALVTNVPGVTLALHFADCVCIFLLDPENPAIGMVHAGWRGSVLKIVPAAIEAMIREFGTKPESLLAAIGPSICRNCYEVGEEVAQELYRAFDGDMRVLSQFSSTRWRADIKTANHILLTRAGVQDSNIAVSESCTACDADEFFSYRRDGVTGRMGGWMALV